jgi:hypothetical protein
VHDIQEAIRRKQTQQAHLAKQIQALEAAAKELESVAHLLRDDASGMEAEVELA